MNIRTALLKEFSKMNSVKISLQIGSNESLFADLITCYLDKDQEIARRAAWALSFCFEQNPQLFDKYINVFVEIMNNQDCHDAVKRTATQALQFMEIPEELEGFVYDYGINILNDSNSANAVKAYTLSILQNIVLKYPELKQELVSIVQSKIEFETPAFKSRAKKLLKELA